MRSLLSDTLTMRVAGVRITVFCSAIVIDVIVPVIVWLGFDPFRPVQNHIGSGAGNPAIVSFVLDRDVGHHV